MVQLLLGIAAVLALLQALSLFAKTEGFRGSGRLFGGVSTILIGIVLLQVTTFVLASWVLVLCGIVAVGSGARKFARRKLPQS
ncbi:MAG TPA: hypothetical protein V6D17_18565 [Candidatus Obscuribacterales bacterium]